MLSEKLALWSKYDQVDLIINKFRKKNSLDFEDFISFISFLANF